MLGECRSVCVSLHCNVCDLCSKRAADGGGLVQVKKVGKYEIGKTIGEGTFGKVKLGTDTDSGNRVAIKVLDKERIQKQNMGTQVRRKIGDCRPVSPLAFSLLINPVRTVCKVMKEISIMKMIRHEHVVALKEVLASRTKIFIVLELVTGGELFDKIVSPRLS